MNNNYAPIALFVYNRPWHTQQTIEALLKNELASESDLVIFCDGPKNPSGQEKIDAVRNYVHSISGFKKIEIHEQEKNRGLSNSIIAGVTETVNNYGTIIVLEDDMITSPYFLRYMNDALEMYENEDKVISIHGYCNPIAAELPNTFFMCDPGCWGWGTWKRGWEQFNADSEKMADEINRKGLKRKFDFNNSYPFYKMLRDQSVGKVDSWAIRWYASAFLKHKLTLWPGKSLVQNIGMDSSGAHCSNQTHEFSVQLNETAIRLEKIEITESELCRQYFRTYFKSIQIPFIKQCIFKLQYIIKKLMKK